MQFSRRGLPALHLPPGFSGNGSLAGGDGTRAGERCPQLQAGQRRRTKAREKQAEGWRRGTAGRRTEQRAGEPAVRVQWEAPADGRELEDQGPQLQEED